MYVPAAIKKGDNKLMFTDKFELDFDNVESLLGSEAPVLLGTEKLDEINRNLLDLQEKIKSVNEYYETKYKYMEEYFTESEIYDERNVDKKKIY